MHQTMKSSVAGWAALISEDRDRSFFGSILVAFACLGALATMLLSG